MPSTTTVSYATVASAGGNKAQNTDCSLAQFSPVKLSALFATSGAKGKHHNESST